MSQESANPVAQQTANSPVDATANVPGKTPGGSPGGSGFTINSKLHSLADLKDQNPKLYEAMMRGIALMICTQAQQQNERFIQELQRERAQEESAG